ncbi:MAG: hypothetical protein AAFP69_20725, partial [Planctomycetota bacterium]
MTPRTIANFRPAACLLVPIVLFSAVCVRQSKADEWTDVTGQKTIIADLVGVWNDRAVLERSDGTRAVIALKNLQAGSRLRALDQAEKLKENRQTVLGEIKNSGSTKAAPKTDEFDSLKPADEFKTLPEAASATGTIEILMDNIESGHAVRGLWQSIPPEMQSELDGKAQEMKAAMTEKQKQDQEKMNAFALRVTGVLKEKYHWIAEDPLVLLL